MDFVFTEMTLNFLAVALLAAAVSLFGLYGIWAGPRQPLRFAFAGMGMSMFFMALAALGESFFYQKWSFICLSLQTCFLVPVGMFLIWFAYFFPRKLEVKQWELPLSLSVAFLIECHEIYWCIQRLYQAMTFARVEWRPDYADYLIVLLFAWVVIVLLRQASRTNEVNPKRSALLRMLNPREQSKRRARNMAALFLVPVVVTSFPTDHPVMSAIILLLMATFVLLYLNESPEKTSFMVKLVGVFLCLSLLLITVCGGWILRNDREVLVKDRSYSGMGGALLAPQNQSLSFDPRLDTGGYSLLIKSIDWDDDAGSRQNTAVASEFKIELPFTVPFFGTEHQVVYLSVDGYVAFGHPVDFRSFRFQYGNHPMIIPALMDIHEQSLSESEGLYTFLSEEKAVFSWINVGSNRNEKLKHTFQVVIHSTGRIELNYREMDSANVLYKDIHYPMDIHLYGLLPADEIKKPHRVHQGNLRLSSRANVRSHGLIHDQTLMLLQAGLPHGKVFSVALIILFILVMAGLPFFFHQILIRPLHALLHGVDQVNTGRLDTRVPVFFMDEIGYLARSFNRMVAFVHRSTEELKSYRSMLEEKVKDRTRELEIAKAEAEKANEAKGVFLANMSHELRTPLHPIIGFSQLVSESNNLTEEQLDSLKIIHNSGNHLLSLINDILQVSKAEAGKGQLVESNFDLRALLDELKGMVSIQESKEKVPLVWEIPKDLPEKFRSDPNKIKQVLLNLVGNSLKFTHLGKISIGLQWQYAFDEQYSTKLGRKVDLRFTVSDTGEGIPEKDMADLFKPFFQTGSGLQSQKGAGLGLSICKHYAELLGADLRIESELGEGTTVYFDLSLQSIEANETLVPGIAPELSTHTDKPNSSSHFRILVAEDDPINSKLLKAMLTPCGYRLRMVKNGLEAVDAAKAWQPHLILMDIRMPIMDGREAAQQIISLSSVEQWSLRPVIIALTADVQQSERAQFAISGFDHVMIKPCPKKDLLNAIGIYLAKEDGSSGQVKS